MENNNARGLSKSSVLSAETPRAVVRLLVSTFTHQTNERRAA
jgi:hypothetical protein